ncbi:MAG TPA: hypothetical protein ENN49_06170 [Bacteroidales bacterium]|nr:hypothetical protein [Bacteroidales bacterium]
MAGMIKNYNAKTDGTCLTQELYETMFTAGNNTLYTENTDLKLTNAWNWGNVNPMPQAGSPAHNGASFTGLTGFETVTFRGGFGTQNWTEGWYNWDRQNTTY